MSTIAKIFLEGMLFALEDHMTKSEKNAECRATRHRRSSRSMLRKAHRIFHNSETSTMADTFQKGVLFTIEGHITELAKPPNAEPQGCPEALDRSDGKLTKHRQLLKPFRNGCFFRLKGHMAKSKNHRMPSHRVSPKL